MLKEFIGKLNDFATHHQLFFAALIGLSIICVSWGIEKILEYYIFPQKKLADYIIAIVSGLTLLLFIQHFILHVL